MLSVSSDEESGFCRQSALVKTTVLLVGQPNVSMFSDYRFTDDRYSGKQIFYNFQGKAKLRASKYISIFKQNSIVKNRRDDVPENAVNDFSGRAICAKQTGDKNISIDNRFHEIVQRLFLLFAISAKIAFSRIRESPCFWA
jgi:hypothetical protein